MHGKFSLAFCCATNNQMSPFRGTKSDLRTKLTWKPVWGYRSCHQICAFPFFFFFPSFSFNCGYGLQLCIIFKTWCVFQLLENPCITSQAVGWGCTRHVCTGRHEGRLPVAYLISLFPIVWLILMTDSASNNYLIIAISIERSRLSLVN